MKLREGPVTSAGAAPAVSSREDLLALLRSKRDRLNRASAKIASFIAANLDHIPFLTSRELAREAGASEATVCRLCVLLGFKGYPDFVRSFRAFYPRELSGLDRFERSMKEGGAASDTVGECLARDIAAIEELRRIPAADVARFAAELHRATEVLCVGFRASGFLASHMGYSLSLVRKNVHVLVDAGSVLLNRLAQLEASAAVFTSAFERYPAELLAALRFAKGRCTVLGLVDDEMSAPAAEMTMTLRVPFSRESFAGDFAPAVALIHAVVGEVARIDPDRTARALAENEQFYRGAGVFG